MKAKENTAPREVPEIQVASKKKTQALPRLQTQEEKTSAVAELKEVMPEKVAYKAHLFQKGQSGNPDGANARLTKEQKDALEKIRALAPRAVEILESMLEDEKLAPTLRIRICEIILERTYGRPEASVKLTSVTKTVEQSRGYVLELVETVRQTCFRKVAGEECVKGK